MREVTAELILDARAWIGEGPVWRAAGHSLLWVDVAEGLIHTFDPRSGRDSSIGVGQPVGSVCLAAGGGLVAALRDGFGFMPAGERVETLVPVEEHVPGNRMNDGKCDCRGRFWAGTMAADHTRGAGTLYRLERQDGAPAVEAMLPGSTISNGLDWSPDNRLMYYIDSPTQRIDVFDFDAESGRLDNRRPFVEIPSAEGLPDGMTVDAEGYVWVALFRAGRVRRYGPQGSVSMEIRLPVTLVTSCAFGGEDLQDLYITTARHRLTAAEAASQPTAGGLFVCRPGPVGRLPFLFGDRHQA